MSWKNWPSWLKGGFIGLILGILSEIGFFICTNYCLGLSCIRCLIFLPVIFFVDYLIEIFKLTNFFETLLPVKENLFNLILPFLVNLIGFILLGMLIGWVFERIRK
jgi:hypothetical protein